MNIKDWIQSVTTLNENQVKDSWATVTKNKKQMTPPRGKGEKPFELISDNNFSNKIHVLKQRNIKRKNNSCGNISLQKNKSKIDEEIIKENTFAHIVPSVREVNGGWNTQSNEVIEKRYRERQQKYIEENMNLSSTDSSSTISTGQSSETTNSYKTATQDSYELLLANHKARSEKLMLDLEKFRKNALMTALIQMKQSNDIEEENINTENLHITSEEEIMRNERLGRLFQSQEDEDVYYHPLHEHIQNNVGSQNFRLQRKGTETILSARQYFLNVDDESFTFQKPNKSN